MSDLETLRPIYAAWMAKHDPDGEWQAALDAVSSAEAALEAAKANEDQARWELYRRMMENGDYPDQRYAL